MEHEPDGPVEPDAHGPPTGEPEIDRTADEPPVDPAGTPDSGGLSPEEEPTTTGTLFIMILFLMALAGMWGIMYLTLLNL